MVEIVTVTEHTVEKHGFFCKMSARKTKAWADKRNWLQARFAEGLQLRLLGGGGRGVVEFIPGAYAWRGIDEAEDFVVIHCMWVVGRSKGQGFTNAHFEEVETWARSNGFRGVAALTSTGNWLISPEHFEKRGYQAVDHAPPGYALHRLAFRSGPEPRLSSSWEEKTRALGPGLVVLRSAQCPYLEDAAANARSAAEKFGLAFADRLIETASDIRHLAPSPYGVYALALDGKLIANTYLLEKDVVKLIEAAR